MSTSSKHFRTRFIAFAFAASDLLLEVDKRGNIVFTSGQVQSLTGLESDALAGRDYRSIFCETNRDDLTALMKGVQKAGRLGPLVVSIANDQSGKKQRAIVMGMVLPDYDNVYLALNATESFFDFLTVSDQFDERLLSSKQFESSAVKAFQAAKREGKQLDITFFEMDRLEAFKKKLGFEEATNFTENFQKLLRAQSYSGHTASQVDNNKYAIVHDTEITPTFIEEKIQELVEKSSKDEKVEIGLQRKTVNISPTGLKEGEARRALLYTIKKMESKGLRGVNPEFDKSFEDYLDENSAKITQLKRLVGKQAFVLNFQPIVELPDQSLSHYEALVRFSTDESPYELIVFGEDIGIAPDIDMAILQRAIGTIGRYEKEKKPIRIAVNISGQSIQSESFIKKMMLKIQEAEIKPENLLFEITESTAISNLERVNGFIQQIRKKGFEVCLDDFGAGSSSFQYLNALDIDCVKIDGKYIRDSLSSARDETMVRNLVRMCRDLKVSTIAEMVETQEQADYLVGIGVDKAQGWLYGKPQKEPSYKTIDINAVLG